MVMTTATRSGSAISDDHDWREAGDAWGAAAADWSCLFEHYAIDVTVALHEQVGVAAGRRVLDIACGSGLAMRLGAGRGARMAGIDASRALVEIARERNPEADVVLGSMFDLPWDDGAFDAVTSINGIWGGCQPALREAHRVLRPGGLVGFSFWGNGQPLDLKPVFKVFARRVPDRNLTGMKTLNNVAFPGVAETMLQESGFEVVGRGSRTSVLEFPDDDIAYRALISTGPAYPAVRDTPPEVLRAEVLDAIAHCRDERGTYRFRNDHQFVLGRRA